MKQSLIIQQLLGLIQNYQLASQRKSKEDWTFGSYTTKPYKSFMTYQPGSAVFAKFVKGNSIEIRRVPDTDFVAKLRNEE